MSEESLSLLHHYMRNSLTAKIRQLASRDHSSNLSDLAISVIRDSPDNSLEINLQLFSKLETSSGLGYFTKYLRSFVAGNILRQLYHKSDFGIAEFTEAMKMLANFSDSSSIDRHDLMSKMVCKLILAVYAIADLETCDSWLGQVEDLRSYEYLGSFADDIQRTLEQKVHEVCANEMLRSPERSLECVRSLQRLKRFPVLAESMTDLQVFLLDSFLIPNPSALSPEVAVFIRSIGLESNFEQLLSQTPVYDQPQDLFEDARDETEDFVTVAAPLPKKFSLISSSKDYKVLNTLMVKGRDDEICVRILKVKLKKFLVEQTDIVCIKTFTTPNLALIQRAQAEAASIERALELPTSNICKAYDTYLEHLAEEGLYCFGIIMEWFEAGDLESEIKQRATQFRPWQEYELMQVFNELITALKVMEQHNICHSDIKPHNIFKASDLVYKIGDFGVAKKQIYSSVMATQTIAGTDVYFSPQCAVAYDTMKSHTKVRARYDIYKSDVFSLGLTYLRMSLISALPRGCSVFEINKRISINGLNRLDQAAIDAKVDSVVYTNRVKNLLKAMLQVDEQRRPTFTQLLEMSDLQETLMTMEGGKIGSLN